MFYRKAAVTLFSVCFYLYPSFSAPTKDAEKLQLLLQDARQALVIRPDSSYQYIRQAENLAREMQDNQSLAVCYQLLGRLFFHEAVYNQSLEFLLKAEELLEDSNVPALRAENLNDLGEVYYYLRRPEKTISCHQKALDEFTRLNDRPGIALTYGYLGHYYEKEGDYEQALKFQNQALRLYNQLRDIKGKVRILENLGSIYEDLGDFAKAEEYFSEAYGLSSNQTSAAETIRILNNLGDIYVKTGRYEKGYFYMEKGLVLARRSQDHYQLRSLYRDFSQLYASKGDFSKAYIYLDSAVTLYKQIYNEYGLRHAGRLQTFFDIGRKDREIALLERDKEINRLVILLVCLVLVLAVLIAAVITGRQRLKSRQEKKLYETRQELLRQQLENKTQSLSAQTLHIIEKNQLLQDLQAEIREISRHENKSPQKTLRGLIRKIESNLTHDKDWNDFRQIFEEVHQSFFDKLHAVSPGLSPAELRLAALIKLRIDSSDMATMLRISPDSLRISRYRLRKKLQLQKEEKLSTFIQSL